jgi:hypothetical protein
MAGKKKAASAEGEYINVGTNIRATRKGDVLILRIKLDKPGTLSQSGRSNIIARTDGGRGGFVALDEVTGDDFGMTLTVTKRVAKEAPKAKRKAKRDDDDDD